MKRLSIVAAVCLLVPAVMVAQGVLTLRYSHPNAPTSIAGQQADLFAKKIKEYSNGSMVVEVYPSSQLGSLKEQAEQVSAGVVAFNHNTAAGIGSLFEDFAVLDTPFLYKDVNHLLKVTDPQSAIMKKLNEGLLAKSKVRVLYTFYFGSRLLTADRAVKTPADLKGLKIRAVPFPIYQAALEGMGAIPTPIDWAETPASIKTKVVVGQENPSNTILAAKLYEIQSHLMLTNHILGAEIVIMNDAVWNKLSKDQQAVVLKAAKDAADFGTKQTVELEASEVKALKEKGMTVIGAAEGLDLEAFRAGVKKVVDQKFGAKWAEYYKLINSIK